MKKTIFILIASIACITCTNNSVETSDVSNAMDKDSILVEKVATPLSQIQKEIISNPESPNVYLKRALYYQKERQFGRALEDINRALNLAPDVSILQYHKASILYEYAVYEQDISLLDEAKLYLDNSIKEDLQIIPPRLLRAKIFLFEKDTEESMRLINDVLKVDQRVAEAYLIKGMIYHFLGNSKLAISSYQTAIEVDPDYFDAYINMGMIMDKIGDQRAIDYYNSAIEIYPNSLEAHRNKGLHLHFNNDYKSARLSFKEVTEIDPTFEEAFFNIGNTFLGEYALENKVVLLDSAFYYFDRAQSMNKYYVQAIHNLGLCYELKGEIELAKENYQRAIDLDNNYTPSLDAINSLN